MERNGPTYQNQSVLQILHNLPFLRKVPDSITEVTSISPIMRTLTTIYVMIWPEHNTLSVLGSQHHSLSKFWVNVTRKGLSAIGWYANSSALARSLNLKKCSKPDRYAMQIWSLKVACRFCTAMASYICIAQAPSYRATRPPACLSSLAASSRSLTQIQQITIRNIS